MTKYQLKLCKTILKYKKLDRVLSKLHFDDYDDLVHLLPYEDLDTEDTPDGGCILKLSDDIIEEYEQQRADNFYKKVHFAISIAALITSIIGLLATIGSDLFLKYCNDQYQN